MMTKNINILMKFYKATKIMLEIKTASCLKKKREIRGLNLIRVFLERFTLDRENNACFR